MIKLPYQFSNYDVGLEPSIRATLGEMWRQLVTAINQIVDAVNGLLAQNVSIPLLVTIIANEATGGGRTVFSFKGIPVAVFVTRQLSYPLVDYTVIGNQVTFAVAPLITDTVYAIVK